MVEPYRDDDDDERVPLMNSSPDLERQDGARAPGDGANGSVPTTTGNGTATARSGAPATSRDHPDAPLPDATAPTGDAASQLEVEEDSSPPTPRFLQDEGSWKRLRWVPYSVRRVWKSVAVWSQGPAEPKDYKIQPLLPLVQEFPILLVERFLRKRRQRLAVVIVYLVAWLLAFALLKRSESFATEIAGWGEPVTIGCGVTYWAAGNGCGLNGGNCRPFSGTGFPFRCPANCASYHVLNPRAVGDQEVIYQPLVVGGPADGEADAAEAFYRGDSFICGAAVHAGVISNVDGGCGVVNLVGERTGFPSTTRNGITSVGFDSYFPLSFSFVSDVQCSARDLRWSLLAVSVVFSVVFSLFVASPSLFFFTIFSALFWHVGLASDPPPHSSAAGLVSNIIGKYLPGMFVAWVMYDKMGVRRTLQGLTAQVEKTILWLGACWVGALENYTFRFIPIQRLNRHDLEQQPGARAALAAIILILLVISATQVYYFRQEGRLRKYLKLYILFIAGILVCLVLPDLNLRIHHYILALLLLPGTSMQTRPALLYQGLLVGLFISGIARWGFDPVLQTSSALQGDAQHNSALPVILPPAIQLGAAMSNISFTWEVPASSEFDGISVLVNDVERFRTYFDEAYDRQDSFLWTRVGEGEQRVREYFRFGYMEGSQTWDYTRAGVWNEKGEWIDMPPGPSKARRRDLVAEEKVTLGRRHQVFGSKG